MSFCHGCNRSGWPTSFPSGTKQTVSINAMTSAALTGPGGGCLRGLAIWLPRHNLPRPQRACPAFGPSMEARPRQRFPALVTRDPAGADTVAKGEHVEV